MKDNNIIHFVGFVTVLDRQAFVDQWTQYARRSSARPTSGALQEKTGGTGKYKYLSQHVFTEEDFSFSFMKGRDSENFPEQKARVVMLGGYTRVETGNRQLNEKSDMKMIVCFNKDRLDIDSYRNLLQTCSFNVYHPFYENCMYGLILEIITNKAQAENLLDELMKRKEGLEISMYHKCQVPNLVH